MSGLLILAGPTATGKTTLALELAGLLEGEVVSADSRQVYRELDIGTAKPSPEELRQVRHHLVDVIGVREGYNAGRFAAEAGAAIADIRSRGRTPIICGGTGFYIETLLAPLFDEPVVGAPKKEKVRRQLRERFEHEGPAELHRELARVDPASAERLHPNDFQRISRALELYYFSGRSM
ncbi:MAG TPA: tRNA (adenosine(37)-N6)-dimethylallyltransferase MiaA, partial [Candidatus Glassbacteria bacterium]|nr:tRNA (adenosine(37)-N6)-dimethylallyltransferase MiaA [Candidatus Glassbacteria bacterium]